MIKRVLGLALALGIAGCAAPNSDVPQIQAANIAPQTGAAKAGGSGQGSADPRRLVAIGSRVLNANGPYCGGTCAYPIEFKEGDEVQAFTDGKRIVVYSGLMRFVANDDELAAVIAHELAHVTMGHKGKKVQNAVVGSIGGLAVDVAFAAAGINTGGAFSKVGSNVGVLAYSKEFEKEADYVGLYYTARAGFDTGVVSDLWRRMAARNKGNYSITHPSAPERYALIEETHREIEAKKASGTPVEPNPKR